MANKKQDVACVACPHDQYEQTPKIDPTKPIKATKPKPSPAPKKRIA